ncbi:tRNA (cytidine(34)-2'-O)-methyltransferase [Victivallis sp. Marseille-Q1083]|uniref:tRNA (cytidine(34)-2'-O)-methyltransferase n=1 Tax=Victivallis sp. Marseille-Q1083 TaxID=2717288 RepID=UPI00158BBC20|nr:tRNA (cytidine(34)-2'-O)-methyltransferase [Victivallis sp. Marseille-Q1083]
MAQFNIVLVHPEIPQNTGNIGRLCVSTDSRLHLVKPLGFSLEDKYLKRSGMDYWPHLDLHVYETWEAFLTVNTPETLFFLSTRGRRSFWDCRYPDGCYLVFGNEGHGLPPEFYERYQHSLLTIPMRGQFHRSFNLANSVAITLFEALRQQEG